MRRQQHYGLVAGAHPHRGLVRAALLLTRGAPREVTSTEERHHRSDVSQPCHWVHVVEQLGGEPEGAFDGGGDVLLDDRRNPSAVPRSLPMAGCRTRIRPLSSRRTRRSACCCRTSRASPRIAWSVPAAGAVSTAESPVRASARTNRCSSADSSSAGRSTALVGPGAMATNSDARLDW